MLGLIRAIRRPAFAAAAACDVIVAAFLAVRFSMLPLPEGHSTAATRYTIKEPLVRPFATLIVPFRMDETLRHPSLGILSIAFVVLVLAVAAGRN